MVRGNKKPDIEDLTKTIGHIFWHFEAFLGQMIFGWTDVMRIMILSRLASILVSAYIDGINENK